MISCQGLCFLYSYSGNIRVGDSGMHFYVIEREISIFKQCCVGAFYFKSIVEFEQSLLHGPDPCKFRCRIDGYRDHSLFPGAVAISGNHQILLNRWVYHLYVAAYRRIGNCFNNPFFAMAEADMQIGMPLD